MVAAVLAELRWQQQIYTGSVFQEKRLLEEQEREQRRCVGGVEESCRTVSPSLSQLVLSNRIPAVNVQPQATRS